VCLKLTTLPYPSSSRAFLIPSDKLERPDSCLLTGARCFALAPSNFSAARFLHRRIALQRCRLLFVSDYLGPEMPTN
jgi:hypothetical protein